MDREEEDNRLVIWFDIDHTLYSQSCGVAEAMRANIYAYFVAHGLITNEVADLHMQYFSTYGHPLRGLVRHHAIDPLDYDRQCDGSLPLEDMLKPQPGLRKLFQDIDRKKARVWALTNAYRLHAERVLRILGLDDQIEGLVYCNYTDPNFSCKPDPEFYKQALEQAKTDPSKCLFIDDSRRNVETAVSLGWGRCVHYHEIEPGVNLENSWTHGNGVSPYAASERVVQIHDLEELRAFEIDFYHMHYIPRHRQPFTLERALELHVDIIHQEINRLQLSLQHLKATQDILLECIKPSPGTTVDPDLANALEENKEVISSQEERIVILRFALSHKGALHGGHYDLTTNAAQPASDSTVRHGSRPTIEDTTVTGSTGADDEQEGEIDL